jgi:hypothetical protein
MSRETDRPHRSMRTLLALAYDYVNGEFSDPELADEIAAVLAAPPQEGAKMPNRLGHQYEQDGEYGACVRCEVMPHADEALLPCAVVLAQEGERQPCPRCNEISDLAASLVGQACERHMEAIRAMSPAEFYDAAPQTCHWCDRERLAAAPTPDREALRERIGNLLDGELCAVTRHGSTRERAVVRERALDRILDLPAALPGGREREPDWRPIATAPRSHLLPWESPQHPILVATTERVFESRCCGPSAAVANLRFGERATHWMPLPAAPQASTDAPGQPIHVVGEDISREIPVRSDG